MLECGGDDPHVVGLHMLAPALKQLPCLGVEVIEGPVWEVSGRGHTDVAQEDSEYTHCYDDMDSTEPGWEGFQSGHQVLGAFDSRRSRCGDYSARFHNF